MASLFSLGKPTPMTATLIAPHTQAWVRNPIGIDHAQNTIYSGNEDIRLSFPPCSVTMAREWLEAASGGSINITVLSRWGANPGGGSWTDLSAVHLVVDAFPAITAAHSTAFTIVVKGASAA